MTVTEQLLQIEAILLESGAEVPDFAVIGSNTYLEMLPDWYLLSAKPKCSSELPIMHLSLKSKKVKISVCLLSENKVELGNMSLDDAIERYILLD